MTEGKRSPGGFFYWHVSVPRLFTRLRGLRADGVVYACSRNTRYRLIIAELTFNLIPPSLAVALGYAH